MKKILSVVLIISMMLVLLPYSIFGVIAAETDSQDVKYSLSDDCTYYYVRDCSSSATSVNIASEINGLPVAVIYDFAFASCSSLTSITIPDSVKEIGNQAFDGCVSLTSIDIPDSVTEIGEQAFADCTSLKNITIPDRVTEIKRSSFYGCKSLESVIIGASVTEIISYAFYNCTALTNVSISDSLKFIGTDAFYGCENLTSVYYKGTASEWASITISGDNESLNSATIYYYSETEPTDNGNYWHYDENGEIVLWKEEEV